MYPNFVNIFCKTILVLVLVLVCLCVSKSRQQIKSSTTNEITDFRYKSCQIDAITRLPNNTFIVVSNGYYWVLNERQTPRIYNVRGQVSQLYPKFKTLDAIFTDPINEMDPKIFLVSHSPRKGVRIACQEFDGQFDTHNNFCHLPVNKQWLTAMKDLDLQKPIDAVTWRNRSKDKDEGFWVFFQGTKMSVIDPYKMQLRFTYDISKWMAINETITATYYDYTTHSFHFFFNNNKYRIWKVNVSLMNSLPMGWDRAFLHGSLSNQLKINKDFFKFPERELRDYSQPYFQQQVIDFSYEEVDEEVEEVVKEDNGVNERIENKLEENSNRNDFQLTPHFSKDLINKKDDNLLDNKVEDIFRNSLYQQSDEAAVSPVMSNFGHNIQCNYYFIYFYFVSIFYRF